MGAHEEHSHVAHVSTRLFLRRSRLDRNHSCTHSTHVLARGRDVWLVDFGTFLALACERAGLCGRKRVRQERRWVPHHPGRSAHPSTRLVGRAGRF